MIPISDENPTFRRPIVTWLILALMIATWIFVQGAGFDSRALATSVCNLGMVPGELTRQAPLGTGIQMGPGLACVVDNLPINLWTPLTSMFLHGGWMHLIGNAVFLWVFGNNVEDSMGRGRFAVFYVVCGLAAAWTHVFMQPGSPVPTVGASGAISGVMGGYLMLYPRVRVKMLFILVIFFFTVHVPAWLVLIWWFALQVLAALPDLTAVDREVSGGVAVWAHVGGFVAGVLLVKLFANPRMVARHRAIADARVAWER